MLVLCCGQNLTGEIYPIVEVQTLLFFFFFKESGPFIAIGEKSEMW